MIPKGPLCFEAGVRRGESLVNAPRPLLLSFSRQDWPWGWNVPH